MLVPEILTVALGHVRVRKGEVYDGVLGYFPEQRERVARNGPRSADLMVMVRCQQLETQLKDYDRH